MREIMFRGLDATGQKKWVYGDLVHNKKVTRTGLEDRVMVGGYEVFMDSVGQFTGLKDKNGREIYEGDIIKIVENLDDEPYNSEVKFYKGVFGVENWTENTRNRSLTTLNYFMPTVGLYDDEQEYTVEVLGNIYENKDLLKKNRES